MSLLGRLFGFKDPSPAAIRLATILILIGTSWSIAFQISTTFWMIYIAEALGGGNYLLGLSLVGVLVVVRIAVQTLLDYPTGGIGDWLGQRWIIASALACYAVVFWLTSIATPETPFVFFLLIYILMGLGASQESGAIQAWFDNNYRVAMPHDKDRKQFGVFQSRIGMIFQLISTLILIPGSILALLYQRQWVFQLQAIFFVFLAILTLILIKDLPGARKPRTERLSFRGYGTILKDGIKYVGSSRFITFSIAGQTLLWAIGIVWWEILLFPFYFGYLLTDIAVSAFRTSMFAPMVIAQERSGVVSQRFDPVKWIPRLRFIHFGTLTFFLGLSIVSFLFPPAYNPSTFITLFIPFTAIPILTLPLVSIVPIVLIYVIFVATDAIARITEILNHRITIDVYPNRIRNSMYSLEPTLAMLCSIPLILLISWLTPIFGFPLTFAICAVIAFTAALFIRKAFTYPIPKTTEYEESEEEQVKKEEPVPKIGVEEPRGIIEVPSSPSQQPEKTYADN